MSKAEEISVLDKRVRLRQPAGGFRTSLDSVMLAAACPAKEGESILDLGCGVGGAGLCVLTRVADTTLTGIDIQEDHIELAKQNAESNNLAPRTNFLPFSVLDYGKLNISSPPPPRKRGSKNAERGDSRLRGKSTLVHHIICNPPYQESDNRTPSPSQKKETACAHQNDVNLQDWIDCAVRNLKSKGSLTIIHRADMTDKILQSLGSRFGGTEVIPLWPRKNAPAKRVIIRTYRDSHSPATIHHGLVLHNKKGDYTEEAEKILRGALPIA